MKRQLAASVLIGALLVAVEPSRSGSSVVLAGTPVPPQQTADQLAVFGGPAKWRRTAKHG